MSIKFYIQKWAVINSRRNTIVTPCVVPWLSTTAPFDHCCLPSIMALWSTSCRGERHGVGKGGERGRERSGERKGTADGNRNVQGTAIGEAGGSEKDNGNRRRKSVHWWGTRWNTRSPIGKGVPLRFGTYNIRNGRNRGLKLALWGMAQANMDLDIFQETKCKDGIYTRESAGYSVITTDAPNRHCGEVAVLYRPSPHFAVEAVRQFGPNVVGFQLATGARRWYIIGCYLAPDNTSTIESVVATLKERPQGSALLVAGDLSMTLTDPERTGGERKLRQR